MKRLFALLALGLIAPAMFVGCGEGDAAKPITTDTTKPAGTGDAAKPADTAKP